ncbi:TPA: biotin/lipoyl-binding protein [Klebsiella pneumoniae]|nr:biotin/lipoyl-binding protein [Klebsiella pneumoniae]
METLMLLTYAALCIVVFKVFRIPLNKWTVPTAVLGGIALIGAVIFGMNYNFPYTDVGNQVFRTVPIVSQVRGRVQSVPVKPNQMLHKGDVLFTLDPTPFQAKVDDLQAQIKAASQDALSLNAAFRQNALQRLHKGEPAELMFPAIPGTVFRGEVADVLPAIGESQFQGQGKLLTTDALNTHGRALVVLKVTDPRFAEYALPQGATLEAAVYSDHLKELSLIRKILIRMKSWENYIYLDH